MQGGGAALASPPRKNGGELRFGVGRTIALIFNGGRWVGFLEGSFHVTSLRSGAYALGRFAEPQAVEELGADGEITPSLAHLALLELRAVGQLRLT